MAPPGKKVNVTGPVTRVHASAAYDYKNKVVLIFGGFGPEGILSDTWSFDGNRWKQLNAEGPPNRLPQGMIYDGLRETVILITFMLNSASQSDPLKNEMWEWTGNSWKKLPYSM